MQKQILGVEATCGEGKRLSKQSIKDNISYPMSFVVWFMKRMFGLLTPGIPLFSPYFTISQRFIQYSLLTIFSRFALFYQASKCFRPDTIYWFFSRFEFSQISGEN